MSLPKVLCLYSLLQLCFLFAFPSPIHDPSSSSTQKGKITIDEDWSPMRRRESFPTPQTTSKGLSSHFRWRMKSEKRECPKNSRKTWINIQFWHVSNDTTQRLNTIEHHQSKREINFLSNHRSTPFSTTQC